MAGVYYPSLVGDLLTSRKSRQEWVKKLSNECLALALKACGSSAEMLEDGFTRKMSERNLLDILEEAPGDKFHLIGSFMLDNPTERARCSVKASLVSSFSDSSNIITSSVNPAEDVTVMVVEFDSCTADKEAIPSLDAGNNLIWPPSRVRFRERVKGSALDYTGNESGGLKGCGTGEEMSGGDADVVSNMVHEKFNRGSHPSSLLVEGNKVEALQRCESGSQVGMRRGLVFSAIGMLMSVLFLAWLLQEYESVQKKEEVLFEAGGKEHNLENSLD